MKQCRDPLQKTKMISIKLDQETETYLAEIITQENTTSEELLKKLIYQHWQIIKPRQTLAQRRGKHPENLLQDAAPDLSLRGNRKQAIAEHIQNRYQKYHQ
jgi:5'(3')-deoxyribonucleotidase